MTANSEYIKIVGDFMDFSKVIGFYFVALGGIIISWCNHRHMNGPFDKGITIKNKALKKFLIAEKFTDYISYVSLTFVILNCAYLLIGIVSFIICFFIPIKIAFYFSVGLASVSIITALVTQVIWHKRYFN